MILDTSQVAVIIYLLLQYASPYLLCKEQLQEKLLNVLCSPQPYPHLTLVPQGCSAHTLLAVGLSELLTMPKLLSIMLA